MKRTRILATLALAVTGCAGLIGVPDLTLDATGGDAGANQNDGSSADGTASGDAAADAFSAECNANLQQDPDHCGRCNHPCGGGTCTAGKCDPVTLAEGLNDPTSIALDATYAYYITADGVVSRVPKDHTAPSDTLITGLDEFQNYAGVHVLNNQLFFASTDGVGRCNLDVDAGSCKLTVQTVNDEGYASYITSADGILYWTDETTVHRMLPDGGGEHEIATTNHGHDLSSDGQEVYYTGEAFDLGRVQVDGGNSEDIGPKNWKFGEQFVAQNGDSFFYAYVDADTDAGHVYGAPKSNPNSRTEFPPSGAGQVLGVAADALYVYWSDAGGFQGPDFGAETTGDGHLFACPRAGCAPTGPLVLATGLKGSGQIQLDDNYVYFLENNNFNTGGRLRKVAKP